jgi:adenosylhomocysteine nucleosidase
LATIVLTATDEEFDSLSFLKLKSDFLLMKTGIGMVNAAMQTYEIIKSVKPKSIILTGLAGAVAPDLEIADIVLADRIFQHDSFRSSDDGIPFFIKPGVSSLRKEDHSNPYLPCDQDMSSQLSRVFENAFNFRAGTLASGSEFMCSETNKNRLYSIDKSILAIDMESAGCIQVAARFNVPFVCFKVISDLATPPAPGGILTNYLENKDRALKRLEETVTSVCSN